MDYEVNFLLNTKLENNDNKHLCTKHIGDEYLGSCAQWNVTWYKLLTFTNYAQPQHGDTREKENCEFIMAGNRLSAFLGIGLGMSW